MDNCRLFLTYYDNRNPVWQAVFQDSKVVPDAVWSDGGLSLKNMKSCFMIIRSEKLHKGKERMENEQTTNNKSNIIAIISYIMVGLAVISIIVFIIQKFSLESKVAALREKGNAYFSAEDYEAAIATYNEAIAIDPDNKDMISRIKYIEMTNNNISFSEVEPNVTDSSANANAADTEAETETETSGDANAEISKDDPLQLGEEGVFGVTWNDFWRDNAEEYIKECALKDTGFYDESNISDDYMYYWTDDNNPEQAWLRIEDDEIIWGWRDDADFEKAHSEMSLSYSPDSKSMTLKGLPSEQCRFFGFTFEELSGNLNDNDIHFSGGHTVSEGKEVGETIDINFKPTQGEYTRVIFWFNSDGTLDMITYNAK